MLLLKRSLIPCLLVVATLSLQTSSLGQHAPLPEALIPYETMLSDIDQILPAVREFERTQLESLETYRQKINEAASRNDTEAQEEIIQEALGQLNLVRTLYDAALAHHPNSALLHNYYGEFLDDSLGETAAAIRHWTLASTYDKNLSRPYNNLGIYYFHSGQYELGLTNLDKAIKLEKDNPDYLFNLVQMYMIHTPQIEKIRGWNQKKLYREAMKHSKRAAELAPDDFELQRDYAMNFFAAERFEVKPKWRDTAKAWQMARKAAPQKEDEFMTWLNEGRVWLRDNKYKEAITCLESALEINPDSNAAKALLEEAKENL